MQARTKSGLKVVDVRFDASTSLWHGYIQVIDKNNRPDYQKHTWYKSGKHPKNEAYNIIPPIAK